MLIWNISGLKSLEQHSVSGSSSVQGLSQLVAEKLVKYLQQEGLVMLLCFFSCLKLKKIRVILAEIYEILSSNY